MGALKLWHVDLIPWLGIKSRPSALGEQSPSHWTPREVLTISLWIAILSFEVPNHDAQIILSLAEDDISGEGFSHFDELLSAFGSLLYIYLLLNLFDFLLRISLMSKAHEEETSKFSRGLLADSPPSHSFSPSSEQWLNTSLICVKALQFCHT